ncbi:MAG: hypothetical protein R3E77_05360 [Steroidobacteraceae bacterium]
MRNANRFIMLMALCLALASPSLSLAHGNHKAMHGGLVKSMGETIVELVVEADGARIYLRDEAEGTPLSGSGGKLIARHEDTRSESDLVPDGNGALTAKGVKLVTGTRVSVQVILADGQTRVAANFAIP